QAEDGIRYWSVTGVQTCALPIFVDDSLYAQTGDFAGVFCRLTLDVVEVSGHGDDCLGHFVAEKLFGCEFESLQQDRRDLGWRVVAAANSDSTVAVWRFGYLIGADLAGALNFLRVELPSH